MLTEYRAVLPLRIFLVVLFGILLVFQTLSLPGGIAHMAQESPEAAAQRWPLTAVAVFLVFCAQVVIVSTWMLLGRVTRDRIFSPSSLVWVDAIVWAMAAAWVVLVGLLLWVGSRADDPGAPFVLLLMTVGLTVVGLLMVVMRALLRQATTLRTDLEAVI